MKNYNVRKLLSILVFTGIIFPGLIFSQQVSSIDNIHKKVSALMEKMTLEEKIGQMNQYNGFWNVTEPLPREEKSESVFLSKNGANT